MKILIISTYDSVGGASVAAYRLHRAFNKEKDLDCRMLVMKKNTCDNKIVNARGPFITYLEQIRSAACTKLTMTLLKASYLFSCGRSGISLHNNPNVAWADIIFIHWTGGSYVSIKGIRKLLKTNKPVLLYLHDMNYITGGCHHSFECDGYKHNCINCPIIKSKYLKFVASITLNKKVQEWTHCHNLFLLSPSAWLRDCAQNSRICPNKEKVIIVPNLIDTTIFKPIDRSIARKILNLNTDKQLICFGSSVGLNNSYKGWNYLIKALEQINDANIEIVLFGSYLPNGVKSLLNFKVHELGYLNDSYSLMLMYNACNVFVNPSLAESFGQTALESISCGTIAVGFNVGGLSDIIKHNLTGYLADYLSVDSLSQCIELALRNNSITRDYLHQFAEERFSEHAIIDRYKTVFTLSQQ